MLARFVPVHSREVSIDPGMSGRVSLFISLIEAHGGVEGCFACHTPPS